jgi:hypothetical protein
VIALRVLVAIYLALVQIVVIVLVLPVALVAIGAHVAGDSDLEAKCERILDRAVPV